jgi:hypothetical protein
VSSEFSVLVSGIYQMHGDEVKTRSFLPTAAEVPDATPGMGFEKALQGIECSPRDAKKVGAYLLLVAQEKNADVRAEAYAHLALAIESVDPLAALDYIESAFKLAPHNTLVLRTLVALFERRGRRDAADAVRACLTKEGPVPPDEKASSLARQGRKEKDLCLALIRHCGAAESHLAVAAEFVASSHSVVGLVHFCHYLVFVGQIRDAAAAAAWVKDRVDQAPPTSKARQRYQELLAPLLTRPSAD